MKAMSTASGSVTAGTATLGMCQRKIRMTATTVAITSRIVDAELLQVERRTRSDRS